MAHKPPPTARKRPQKRHTRHERHAARHAPRAEPVREANVVDPPPTPSKSPIWWRPKGVDVDSLPQEIRGAVADIVDPLYQQLVLDASDPLEKSTGLTVVHLVWQEILDQQRLAQKRLDDPLLESLVDREELLIRHLHLVDAKIKATGVLVRLRQLRLHWNSPTDNPASAPPPSASPRPSDVRSAGGDAVSPRPSDGRGAGGEGDFRVPSDVRRTGDDRHSPRPSDVRYAGGKALSPLPSDAVDARGAGAEGDSRVPDRCAGGEPDSPRPSDDGRGAGGEGHSRVPFDVREAFPGFPLTSDRPPKLDPGAASSAPKPRPHRPNRKNPHPVDQTGTGDRDRRTREQGIGETRH